MIEKNGLPAVLLTAMTSMAKIAGANRIVASGLIPHPVGDPTRSPEEEFAWRKGRVQQGAQRRGYPNRRSADLPRVVAIGAVSTSEKR